ncbi:transcriptional repressor [Opitutus sp. ER46]|uniref:Fur family transcriptional regulator n=1 Tax=Opitutus sp. ER46 TaxID=2161864 RepID=UPI000D30E9C8|nr:transcriptional repressor [Opitutus sp. ER46]PTX96457.1 Fur family transcriptional regulator [Opitutus sp. ER46]
MIASTQPNPSLPPAAKPVAKPSTPVELATAKLKAAGLRITQPRLAILGAMSKRTQPTSIEQIHEDVGADNCDLVTVYRCVAAFEEIGVVRRAFFHNGTAMYEMNLGGPARYHVVCKQTNRIEELDDATTEELRKAVEAVQQKLRDRGFTDVEHIVEFFGVAPQAAATPAPAAAVAAQV